MKSNRLFALISSIIAACLAAECTAKGDDTISQFYSTARRVSALKAAHDNLSKDLKPVADGEVGNVAVLQQHIEDLSRAALDRKAALNELKKVPEGTSAQPLLESCRKHLEIQETVWLPEMLKLKGLIHNEKPDSLVKITVFASMKNCMKNEKAALKDLQEKLEAFEKEYGEALKKSGNP